jgi:hypothetical protein
VNCIVSPSISPSPTQLACSQQVSFSKRGEGAEANASTFFTAIACTLAKKVPDLLPLIANALEIDGAVVSPTRVPRN